MEKHFNITGACNPNKHFMVDLSQKMNKILKMIDAGEYFVINRPRQYGKTTMLYTIKRVLKDNYLVINTSFEGVGDDLFSSEKNFCSNILGLFMDGDLDLETYEIINRYNSSVNSFLDLSRAFTKINRESKKPIILLIDEVDKNSNSKIFLQFLGVLRKKYLSQQFDEDKTFQSVVLAGVHDVKNLKLAVRDDNESRFNSPWNIAAKFDVDMSFSVEEIGTMLKEYCDCKDVSFNVNNTAKLIYEYTNGYPYLVCDICKIVDEKMDAVWSEDNILSSIKIILNENNTLFEDVIKNIKNNEDLKILAEEILLKGRDIVYNQFSYEVGIMYGIFNVKKNKVIIHNLIFEICIYNYFISNNELLKSTEDTSVKDKNQFIKDKSLDMVKILEKFQSFMYEEYRHKDKNFYEKNARLIFLAFMKPIINGVGFYFVEAETRENKRMDIVITYGNNKYIVELKIWNGDNYQENGKIQLADYLKIQNVNKGYLVTFRFKENDDFEGKWLNVSDKEIYEIII